MKKIIKKKGISLVETIIYIAIFGILINGLVYFSISLSNIRLQTQKILEVNNQGSQILKLINQTVRNGSLINIPTIGNSDTSLSILTDISTTSPTIFSEVGGMLYVTEGISPPIALTNNKVFISNLLFSNLSALNTPNIIKISFTITSSSTQNPYSVNFNGSSALRK